MKASTRFRWICALSVLPLFLLGLYIFSEIQDLESCSQQLSRAQAALVKTSSTQRREKCLQELFANSDPAYVSTALGSLVFCQKERDTLDELLQHPGFASNTKLAERCDFLHSAQNRLSFGTDAKYSKSVPGVSETLWVQLAPVQLAAEDLAALLSLIESYPKQPQTGACQLFITNMSLARKKVLDNEVYELSQLKLLARNYTPQAAT